jgi:hypothetical protein
MSPLYLYNNKLLINDNKLAASQNCCCCDCDCDDSDAKFEYKGTSPTDAAAAGGRTAVSCIGTYQWANIKAYINEPSAGREESNPAAGYWGPNLTGQGDNPTRLPRSWEILWNNNTKTVIFKIYDNADWTGDIRINLTRTLVIPFASDEGIVGLQIFAIIGSSVGTNSVIRTGSPPTATIVLSNVQYNDGSGFTDIPLANDTYTTTGSVAISWNKYYRFCPDVPNNFTIRGVAQFPAGFSGTNDNFRFNFTLRKGKCCKW